MKRISTITSFNVRLNHKIFHFIKSYFNFIIEFILWLITFVLQLTIFIHYHLPVYILIIFASVLIASFVYTLYNLIKLHSVKKLELDLKQAQLYNQTLKRLNDDVRCFRHDFSNILTAIGGYIKSENMDGLKSYYSNLMNDCNKINCASSLSPDVINNPAIYAILANKYYLAEEKRINISLDIFLDLNKLKIPTYDFTRILGILMDNAIEEAKECNEKIINVCIKSDTKASRQVLIVENTYRNKNIDTERIYEKGFSSKPNNTGLGLWEVRRILKNYTNLNLYTSKDEKFFKQQLENYN